MYKMSPPLKLVLNGCHGGFGLSDKAIEKLRKLKNVPPPPGKGDYFHVDFYDYDKRSDPDLIAVVEELGEEANGEFADLYIEEVGEHLLDIYYIDEYDGYEYIAISIKNYEKKIKKQKRKCEKRKEKIKQKIAAFRQKLEGIFENKEIDDSERVKQLKVLFEISK